MSGLCCHILLKVQDRNWRARIRTFVDAGDVVVWGKYDLRESKNVERLSDERRIYRLPNGKRISTAEP